MELHQLRYFVAVAQAGNFSRAAEKCFVSQPSLSQQIQKLEYALGAELPGDFGRRCEIALRGREQRLVAIAIDNAAALPASG